MNRNYKLAFTLVELLVALGIVAVLSTAVIVALNPSELLKQARDSTRISDLNTINTALGVYTADVASANTGTSSVVYVSLPDSSPTCANLGLPALPVGWTYACASASNYKKIDGTGWIPANFSRISFGNPLERLPADPKNSTSSGFYYTFVTTGVWWELTAVLESDKYGPRMVVDGGMSPHVFEQGTNLTLTPSEALERGVSSNIVAPTIASISPTSTTAGDPGFTLTVNGANFTSSSAVTWGGSTKATTFVSSTQLTASILAGDIAASGTIAIAVSDPVNGLSGSSNFAISERTQFVAGAWTLDSSAGGGQSYGACMVEAGGQFYMVQGYNTGFQKYNPATHTWTTLANLLGMSNSGASLVKYNNDTLYLLLGNSASFYKYVISTNTWSAMEDFPTATGYAGALAYPGTGDYIYAFGGAGTNYFFRYSVANNSWAKGAAGNSDGTSIVEVSGKYYVIPGYSATFQKFDPATNRWTSLSTLGFFGIGAALVKYDNDTIYAFRGRTGAEFDKYTISTNTWAAQAAAPGGVYYGGSLTYPGTGNYIYALQGNSSSAFWKYLVTGNSWSAASTTPAVISTGGALTSLNSDTIYAFRGGGSTDFWKYTISTGVWAAQAAAPAGVYTGGSLTNDGTNIYATRGSGTATFWKYSPASNTWSALADATTIIGSGTDVWSRGGVAYSASLGKIYAVSGRSNGLIAPILEYNIINNVWPNMTYAPGTFNNGVSLTALNSDTIYAFLGGGSSAFWKYTISTATWAAQTSAPGGIGTGGSLANDGTNVYAIEGAATTAFWKYTSASNTWSVLASTTVAMGAGDAWPRGGLLYSPTTNAVFAIPGGGTSIYKNSP